MRLILPAVIVLIFSFSLKACKKNQKSKMEADMTYNFDLQGHRGARGLLPENTLAAFQKAIDIGVNTLELDVVISKDSQVVVSHEAYMNPKICLDPKGGSIADKSAYNLYEMNYKAIKAFDCGSLPHPEFPKQHQKESYKPLLKEVLHLVTVNSKEHGRTVNMNIELKSSKQTDNIYHPQPNIFVNLVVKSIQQESIPFGKITLQSFDKRIVKQVAEDYPEISVAYLVAQGNLHDNLKELGLKPQIYSPYYKILDSLQIQQAHHKGIKVIPWTVNGIEAMQELLDMGVDGIITDYPNLAKTYHLREKK